MTSCQHGKRSIRTNTRFCLKAETGVTLYEHESLIIFDEVQLFPQARQAIKHLVADGRYSYLETGSLISIKKCKRYFNSVRRNENTGVSDGLRGIL